MELAGCHRGERLGMFFQFLVTPSRQSFAGGWLAIASPKLPAETCMSHVLPAIDIMTTIWKIVLR